MSQTIAADCVVLIHYTVKNDADEVVDSTAGRAGFSYLHGHKNIVDGLEAALQGASAGAEIAVTLAPKDAYGEHNGIAPQSVKRREIPKQVRVEPGNQFVVPSSNGKGVPVWITAVKGGRVTVDTNHPLAGKTLTFEVNVVSVRAASSEEIAHGHAHGPHGHHQ